MFDQLPSSQAALTQGNINETRNYLSPLAKSPARLFFATTLVVFASEAVVMLLLHALPQLSMMSEAIADAMLLVLLISPAIYFFLFRPMVSHIRAREAIEVVLHRNEEEQFKHMLRASLDGFLVVDAHDRFLEVNDAYCNMLGYSREELLSFSISDIEADETPRETARHIYKIVETGSDRFETRQRCKDGHLIYVEVSANYSNLHSGRMYCFLRDITERKRNEELLMKSEANLLAILDNLPYLTWLKDCDGRYITINKVFADYLHLEDAREATGKTDLDLHPKELAEKYRADDIEVMTTRKQRHLEEAAFDGKKLHWVETYKTPIIDAHGKVLGTVGFARDITERKLSEEILRENEARLKELFENLSSGVAVYQVSPDGSTFIISAFNRAAERIENIQREDVLGKNVTEVFPGIEEFGLLRVFQRVWQSGVAEHFPVSFYRDGRIVGWRENYVYKLPNGEVVAIYDDITKAKQAEEQMQHLAHYDALTDLPNRTLFSDRLHQAIATAKRDKMHIAVMFIDLDKFKLVNDKLGHDVGDLLLKEVAKRLQHCVRESDTVSRIGGDEFIVLLPAVEADRDAMLVAEKILGALNRSFELADHRVTISASIGVAVYPEHGSDERVLTRNADIAMYYAKVVGRNSALLYQPDMVAG